MSDLRRMSRDLVLSLAGTAATGIGGFAFVVVVARGLGVHRAGAFFEATALFVILATAAEIGADTGLLRSMATFRAERRIADLRPVLAVGIGPVLTIGSALGVVLFVFAPQISG